MFDLQNLQSNKKIALFLAKREISNLVYNAVNLEGVAMTLPEVQTLLDGITVGGHKISDQNMAINQGKTWEFIFDSIQSNTFDLSKEYILSIHCIAGKEEALEWGCFRTGMVRITGSDYIPPSPDKLSSQWDILVSELEQEKEPYRKAIKAFLQIARNQFFWDVNKRTGRFLMNAILLDSGLLAINVPAKKQLEFNQKMLDFYESNDEEPMYQFLISLLDPVLIKNFLSEVS